MHLMNRLYDINWLNQRTWLMSVQKASVGVRNSTILLMTTLCSSTVRKKTLRELYSSAGNFGLEPKQSSGWEPVLWPNTSKTLFRLVNLFGFYLELYRQKFKNFIWTSKFKCSFPGLPKIILQRTFQWRFLPNFSPVFCRRLKCEKSSTIHEDAKQ